jgi:hypothetical protein
MTRHRFQASFRWVRTFTAGDWASSNPALAIPCGSSGTPPWTPPDGRRVPGMLLSPPGKPGDPGTSPPSSSLLSRGYDEAPHGAHPAGQFPGTRLSSDLRRGGGRLPVVDGVMAGWQTTRVLRAVGEDRALAPYEGYPAEPCDQRLLAIAFDAGFKAEPIFTRPSQRFPPGEATAIRLDCRSRPAGLVRSQRRQRPGRLVTTARCGDRAGREAPQPDAVPDHER